MPERVWNLLGGNRSFYVELDNKYWVRLWRNQFPLAYEYFGPRITREIVIEGFGIQLIEPEIAGCVKTRANLKRLIDVIDNPKEYALDFALGVKKGLLD